MKDAKKKKSSTPVTTALLKGSTTSINVKFFVQKAMLKKESE